MENKKLIYGQMIKILSDVDYISKSRAADLGAGGKYNFRGIDDMYNELHKLFAKHKVFIIPRILKTKQKVQEVKTNYGVKLQYNTLVKMSFHFYAEDGSSVKSTGVGHSLDSNDKGTNKAQSSALKYALMQTFLIPTEEAKDVENDNLQVAPEFKNKDRVVDDKAFIEAIEHLKTIEVSEYINYAKALTCNLITTNVIKKHINNEAQRQGYTLNDDKTQFIKTN